MNKFFIITFFLGFSFLSCSKKSPSQASSDTTNGQYGNILRQILNKKTVKVENVKEKLTDIDIYSLGTVDTYKEARIISQISGRIENIYTDVGSKVRAGLLLCKLETKFFQLDVDKKEASFKQAKTQYDLAEIKLKEAIRKVEKQIRMIAKSKYEVKEKEIIAKNLKIVFLRKKHLFKIGGVSKEKYDESEVAYKQALIEYEKAKKTLEAEQIGYRDIDIKNHLGYIPSNPQAKLKALIDLNTQVERGEVKVQKANLVIAQNAYKTAKAYLDECFIKAPFSGVISERKTENGENLSSNSHIMTIIDINRVYVKLNISEKDIGKIKQGMNVKIKADAYQSLTFKGTVKLIEPVIDKKARTFTVRVLVSNADNKLKPGMFARCNILIKGKKRIITIPIKSIVSREGSKGEIFVVKSGRAFKKTVKLGRELDDRIEILEGLSEGENVVIEGNRELYGNEKVIIKPTN